MIMVHPLVTQVEALAQPVAEELGLELVHVVFHTNQFPPVLRVDIRPLDPDKDTSHAHCEVMSEVLGTRLDEADLVDSNYVLEVSSPGLDGVLTTERDFTVFKGFPVQVSIDPPHKGRSEWEGNLVSREAELLVLSQKGRPIKLPLSSVQRVVLQGG